MKKNVIAFLLSVVLAAGSIGTAPALAAETAVQEDAFSDSSEEAGKEAALALEEDAGEEQLTETASEDEITQVTEETSEQEDPEETDGKNEEDQEETEEPDAGLTDDDNMEESEQEAEESLDENENADEQNDVADTATTEETAADKEETGAASEEDAIETSIPEESDSPGSEEEAIAQEEGEKPQLPESVKAGAQSAAPSDDQSNDDLFSAYVDRAFNGEPISPGAKRTKKRTATSQLNTIEKAIYDTIAEQLPRIASGERASTVFEIPMDQIGLEKLSWTAEELGVDAIIVDGEYAQAALDAVEEKCSFDLARVINALMADYPYHLYWYDKNVGTSVSGYDIAASYDDVMKEYLIGVSGSMSISMTVADDYSAGEYLVDISVGQSVQDAVTNAGNIVEQFGNATDYEKLVGYKNEICNLVSYNSEAANGNESYGNPWQMIWVFDGDPETNVVCEGYSKAFKCLCDMSDFKADIESILVTGTMSGGTGEGPHMWNIVKMENKKNYLVDLTNCDEGTVGESKQLFLAGTTEKITENNIVTGYTFIIEEDSVSYQYNQDTLMLYENSDLDISGNNYVADQDAPESLNNLISALPSIEESSIHHYYYNQLTDIQKALYWKLIGSIEDKSFKVYVQLDGRTIESNEIIEVLSVIRAENPMLTAYYDGSSCSHSISENGVLSIDIQKSRYSSYQIERALAKKNQILEAVGDGDRFTQIVNLLTFINRNIIYDYDGEYFNGGTNSNHPHDIMGALLYDACVCEGFSLFIKEICDEKGIPCLAVEGDDASNPNENHMWNIIQMEDEQWYLVDATTICKDRMDEDSIINNILKGKDYVSEHGIYGGVNSIGISVPENGDISVPSIADKGYEYQGTYDQNDYHEGEEIVDEIHHFSYKINKDLITCTVTGYEGVQQGDLIIPDYLDGYRVTSIGNNAFYMNRGFTGNLVIPDTVTEIGEGAFYHCDGLTGNLTLSQNLTRIGRIAFMDCTNLSGSIDLPESLLELDENAFFRCKHISGNVTIPKNITNVFNIFSQCYEISSYTVSSENPDLCSYQGVIYSKDMTQLLLCAPSLNELNIPDSVIVIGRSACFDCPGLENSELTLPPNLQRIEDHAFQGTNLIGDIIIPDSVTYIGYGAFIRSINENVNGRRLVLPSNLEHLGDHVFWNCGFSGEVYLSSSINEIGDDIFPGNQITLTCHCDNSVVTEWYENGSEMYNDEISLYLLHGNQENRSETIVNGTEGVVSVEYDCSACNKHISDLETESEVLCRGGIKWCDITWKIDRDGHLLFSGKGYMNPIPRNLKDLIPIERKESVTEVVIQEGIENVGATLCSGLSSLTSIIIPSSVTKICSSAFSGCTDLNELRIPSQIKTIESEAFSDCTSLNSLILEDGIETIGYSAFINCQAMESVYIPSSVKDVESTAFGYNDRFIIQGISGSAANEYAQKNYMRFIALDDHLDHIGDKGIPLAIADAREATCAEEGLTEGLVCETCGRAVIEQEVIPKLEHTWGDYVTDRLPTCTEEGSESIHCSVCGKVKEGTQRPIAKLLKPVTLLTISGITAKTYTGKAQTQVVVVKDGTTTLVKGTDYTLAYKNNTNAGTASVTIKGTGNYTGSVTKTFTIKKAANAVTAKNFVKTYSAAAQTFALGATAKGGTLTYASNSKSVTVTKAGKVTVKAKFIGKATITITAQNANYNKATKKITVTVVPTKTGIASVTSPAAGQMVVKWKKNAVGTGYQIQYSTSSKFTGAKSALVTKNTVLSKKITNLTKGKKYYVRMRTYKTVGGVKYYSGWCTVKTVTIRK